MSKSSCCSTSSPAFNVVNVPDFDHSSSMEQYFIVVLICISQMTYDEEHLSYAYLHLYIFFSEVSSKIFSCSSYVLFPLFLRSLPMVGYCAWGEVLARSCLCLSYPSQQVLLSFIVEYLFSWFSGSLQGTVPYVIVYLLCLVYLLWSWEKLEFQIFLHCHLELPSLVNFKGFFFFCINWKAVLYHTCLLQIFSPSLWTLFLFSWQCLSQSRIFYFNKIQLISISFMDCAFSVVDITKS